MKINGNLDISGYIDGARLKKDTTQPTFSESDAGRLMFTDNGLMFNDGESIKTVQFSQSSDVSLRATLGVGWVNPNLSFNPTMFNEFNTVSGLNANSTLFDVLSQFDSALSEGGVASLGSIGDVSFGELESGDSIIYDGTNFVNMKFSELVENSSLELGWLSNVTLTELATNDTIVFNGTEFVNKQTSFIYENLSASATEFVVAHQLSNRYCHVTVVDTTTNERIEPLGVTYQSTNVLRVFLQDSAPIRIIVTAP